MVFTYQQKAFIEGSYVNCIRMKPALIVLRSNIWQCSIVNLRPLFQAFYIPRLKIHTSLEQQEEDVSLLAKKLSSLQTEMCIKC